MLPADLVYGLGDVIGQFYVVSVKAFVQLRHGSHADDGAGDLWFVVAKGQRQLRRRQAMFARELVVAAGGVECFRPSPTLIAHAWVARHARLCGGVCAGQA